MPGFPPGLTIAAPASGCGKTLVTLGLLRALIRNGVAAGSVKIGPDYIDPAFHAAATGRDCYNLDLWAMRDATLARAATRAAEGAELLIAEGVMGLFDGAADGRGSTADAAAAFGWPIILIVDARAQGASAAALVRGFATHRPDTDIAGVIFNRVGSEKHEKTLARAMAESLPEIAVPGFIPRAADLDLPSRHLGLVQAREKYGLDAFIDRAADTIARHVDLDRLQALAATKAWTSPAAAALPPPGQRVAVANDDAFGFSYPHVLADWRDAGAEILFFSPLAGDAPDPAADAIYLPGGYPELHAGNIAGNAAFLSGLAEAAEAKKPLYGECGGYMVLGRGLVDADGARHAMAGLLPVETGFEHKKLHLGYRRAVSLGPSPLGAGGLQYTGHEFHYATILSEGPGDPLFRVEDAAGTDLGVAGLRTGSVAGSFMHLIDGADS